MDENQGDDDFFGGAIEDSDKNKGNNEIIEEVPEETEKSFTE